jgi:hypothetical protein
MQAISDALDGSTAHRQKITDGIKFLTKLKNTYEKENIAIINAKKYGKDITNNYPNHLTEIEYNKTINLLNEYKEGKIIIDRIWSERNVKK